MRRLYLNTIFVVGIFLCNSHYCKANDNNPFKMPIHPSNKTIPVNTIIESDTVLYLFDNLQIIYGLSVDMTFSHSDDFLLRVFLESTTGEHYLISEQYKEIIDIEDTIRLSNYCEETISIRKGLIPSCIRIYVRNSSVSISSIHVQNVDVINLTKENGDKSMSSIREAQIRNKVNHINNYNRLNNKLWRAQVTPISLLTFSEKRDILGLSYNTTTNGFEYYGEGIIEFESFSTRNNRDSISPYVPEFDWTNRHGKNWITSIKDQNRTPYCTAFASVAGVEALINLYYNQIINKDLSEQEIACCAQSNNTPNIKKGINPDSALIYLRDHGVVIEEDYPFSNTALQICHRDEVYATDSFVTAGYNKNYTHILTEIQKRLIERGPLVCWVLGEEINHAMLLVGYGTIEEGMNVTSLNSFGGSAPEDIIIGPNDERIGCTYLKFKNSWGTTYNNNGFMYVLANDLSWLYANYSIQYPITSAFFPVLTSFVRMRMAMDIITGE